MPQRGYAGVAPVPSIVSGFAKLTPEAMAARQNAMARLALAANGRGRGPAGTGTVFDATVGATGPAWGVRQATFCGIRGDRCMFGVHLSALIVHLAFAIVCLVFTAEADDPTLQSTRNQFLFTRNGTFCGLQSPSLPTDSDDRPIAVVVGTGTKLNIGVMSAFFFVLSAMAHATWSLALVWDPLGDILLAWLDDARAPLRWLECAPPPPARARARAPTDRPRSQTRSPRP